LIDRLIDRLIGQSIDRSIDRIGYRIASEIGSHRTSGIFSRVCGVFFRLFARARGRFVSHSFARVSCRPAVASTTTATTTTGFDIIVLYRYVRLLWRRVAYDMAFASRVERGCARIRIRAHAIRARDAARECHSK
jgi:hypothetical protein